MSSNDIRIHLMTYNESKLKQAGAELYQAQVQVDLLAELILQLNFRFGQHWKKVSFPMSSYFQLVPAIEIIFYGGCLLSFKDFQNCLHSRVDLHLLDSFSDLHLF